MSVRKPPVSNDPLILQLSDIVGKRSTKQIAHRAGLGVPTLLAWFAGHSPTIRNLQAVLNVLGYELTITKREDRP